MSIDSAKRALWAVLAAGVMLLLGPVPAGARGYLDSAVGFQSGDFDTATRTDLYSLTLTVGDVKPDYDISVSVPFVALKDDPAAPSDSETGIGDVLLRAGRILVPERIDGISMYGSVSVKLPTADETKALGTGEADYGAFLTLNKRLDTLLWTLVGGYINTGDAGDIGYNDIVLYGIGVSRTFARSGAYLSLEGRGATLEGVDDPLGLYVGAFHALDAAHMIRGSAFAGLSDGSPDYGVLVAWVQWF